MKSKKLKEILAWFVIGAVVTLGIGIIIVSLSDSDQPKPSYALFLGVILVIAPIAFYLLRKRIRS